ncbi:MAG: hypothetical protein RSF00_05155 [Oscillospiraceae bacterium]
MQMKISSAQSRGLPQTISLKALKYQSTACNRTCLHGQNFTGTAHKNVTATHLSVPAKMSKPCI